MSHPRRRIDWTREIERIELAAARAPLRRRRRVSLPRAIIAIIERRADEEYGRWLADMHEAIGRLFQQQEQRSRGHP